MATLKNVYMTVTSTQPRHSATVTVECSLEFTEFEVNAMNVLGLGYELGCRILNKDVVRESPVVIFEPQAYPAGPAAGKGLEYPLFAKEARMQDLHGHVFTRDRLIAEVSLKNNATGLVQTERSRPIPVDLAV
jgi:hypothetical protein